MRLGFFLGFVIGAAIATLMSLSEEDDSGSTGDSGPLDLIKRQTREARDAARHAAAEKEAEMLQDWDETRHHAP